MCHPNNSIADPLLQPFTRRKMDDASLLGALLFTGPELDRARSARLVELERAVERMSLLGAQEALVLLRVSFIAPRVQHLLSALPSRCNVSTPFFWQRVLCVIRTRNLSSCF